MREKYLAITGGVGGAKLGLGLARRLEPSALAFLVNTGDDFEHLGLHVSPDIDTLMYTLAGYSNPETGWGRVGESWNFIASVGELGGETWFKLGDRDLAVHVLRTQRLRAGERLTSVTRALCAAAGIGHALLPMSDDPVRTLVHTRDGSLAFQHYFVRERCLPQVTGFAFEGAAAAAMSPELRAWLADPALSGIIVCPSNPFVSIDPILAIPELRARLRARAVPVVAVSPIVAGAALKGPTAKMMQELALPCTAVAVAAHYAGLISGFVLDAQDCELLPVLAHDGLATIVAPTVMVTLDDKLRLADTMLEFLRDLRKR